jgi:hypothetical protein
MRPRKVALFDDHHLVAHAGESRSECRPGRTGPNDANVDWNPRVAQLLAAVPELCPK